MSEIQKQIENWKCEACGKPLGKENSSSMISPYFERYTRICSCGKLNIIQEKK